MKINLMRRSLLVLMLSVSSLVNAQLLEPLELNGFDLSDISVSQDDIFQGGPPREGIPAIDAPKFVQADAVDFISDDDRVLGVEINGVARAYPIRILNWHEIVNDKIGDVSFSVTYCPLCGSGMVFSADFDNLELTFGVSGLLFDNNVLLYDRNTESLWSQVMGEAISGKLKGSRLQLLPVTHTTWAGWRKQHPNTDVLDTDTGFQRDYTHNPYEFYEQVDLINFPLRNIAPKTYGAHDVIIGLRIGDQVKGYPYAELKKLGETSFKDTFNGRNLIVHWDEKASSVTINDEGGELLPTMSSYWFAWYSFYPNAEVFKAKN